MEWIQLTANLKKLLLTTHSALFFFYLPSIKASPINLVKYPPSSPISQNSISPSDKNNNKPTSKPKPKYPTGTGGQPKTRNGQTLGPCSKDIALAALVVPSTVDTGLISDSKNRVFWFYVPYKPISVKSGKARFEIRDETKEVYKTILSLAATPGVIKVSVPDTVQMEDSKWYNLKLSADVYCSPDSMPETDSVEAWVQMQRLNPSLKNKLNQATPLQKATLYEQNGYWYDALTIIAESKRKKPNDENWSRLLRFVQLEKISPQPIVDCCNNESE
ncbi:MAG: DUF928 domain-containing protein [Richelia sp. SM1_7_0]|nr:DUF928 domain-containing protein [Richelia sp. SM1_7_0]NJR16203.1 DUF928 domain-containing protein [Calothrix sp. CSU_2_0]